MISNDSNTNIDISVLAKLLWSGKRTIALCSCSLFIIAIIYALNTPDVYQSSSVLAPALASKTNPLSNLGGQIGSIASLAGINLGNGADESTTYIAILKSRKFINNFINNYDIKRHLFIDSWDHTTQQWKPPSSLSRLKKSAMSLFRSHPLPEQECLEPSDWDAYKIFITDSLNVSEDMETGLITIRVSSYDPELAKTWTHNIIRDLNLKIREEKKAEAEKSITYLKKSIEQTPLVDMQSVFYRLIENQMQTIVLANIKDEFAFTTLDPPVVPQEKSRPNRTLIVISGLLFGFVIGLLIILSKHLSLEKQKTNQNLPDA
ncbi:Wzz/FepE/Etk N-terminal domain-containing protein [Ketobacter alkanivorans]|uniref:Polysaccharide chain length determinant N-terminal domain-containing protein n=1 Tax=Ketobacter alkanivorans TaxID=1917421 RepID=A0A2K9LSE9_9GAMM|nr:Wzz/FepE/Etk N-terminal domain-containing protein [Ketobacter alkanivorans]AUM13754.1 hypothetical protein Kalk_15565 [Ketobacter alkanivorans]